MSSSRMKHKLPLELLEELATNQKPTIVMSEGSEPRIITGAAAAFDTGMCHIVLLGNEIIIKTECKKLGMELPSGIKIIDPEKSDLLVELEKEYLNLR